MRLSPVVMRQIFSHSITHGFLACVLFFAISVWRVDHAVGFAIVALLSAVSAWFRACYLPFAFGALLAFSLAAVISFLFVDGSAGIVMLPYAAVLIGSAIVSGFVAGRVIRQVLQWLRPSWFNSN